MDTKLNIFTFSKLIDNLSFEDKEIFTKKIINSAKLWKVIRPDEYFDEYICTLKGNNEHEVIDKLAMNKSFLDLYFTRNGCWKVEKCNVTPRSSKIKGCFVCNAD